MVVVHAIWTLQLLVSSALLAKVLASNEKKVDHSGGMKKSDCDIFDDTNQDHTCKYLISGVVS
jgi:hypothetical protein